MEEVHLGRLRQRVGSEEDSEEDSDRGEEGSLPLPALGCLEVWEFSHFPLTPQHPIVAVR